MNARDQKLKKNIFSGILFRIATIGLTLLAMPVMLGMVGQSLLGVWLTLLSVFQWLTFFDLGIASGARNAIASAVSENNRGKTRSLVSTGYWYTTLISIATAILFILGYFLLSGNRIFDGSGATPQQLTVTIMVSISLIAVNLVLGYVQQLYAAHESAAVFPVFGFLSNLIFIFLLLLALLTGSHSIVMLGACYGISLCSANLLITMRFFRENRDLVPSIRLVDTSLKGELFSFGLKIFVIQLCAMILFATDRVLVSWLLGPEDVVNYEAAFKIFALITIFHSILMNSYWSSFTQAANRGEWNWIRQRMRGLVIMMIPIVVIAVLLALLARPLISIWLGDSVVSGIWLYWTFAAYAVLSSWSNIFAYFVNGIGRVNLQLASALFAAGINIPLSIFFVRHYNMGVTGVVLATVISLSFFSVLGPIQTRHILGEAGATAR
jgi:O-antigen/teichoic acid export membrane protein